MSKIPRRWKALPRLALLVILAFLMGGGLSGCAYLMDLTSRVETSVLQEEENVFWEEDEAVALSAGVLADPYESLNRKFFTFNDRLYFWVLKPVSQAYSTVIPEDFRIVVRNLVDNMRFPIRFGNNLLQGKPQKAGIELARFATNTTLGLGGLTDPAREIFGLVPQVEDMGQTLGLYGMNDGIYLCLPMVGPSSFRDVLGLVGDYFFDPLLDVAVDNFVVSTSYQAVDQVNRVSRRIGEYEKFKEESFDPYIAMRNAYFQHRLSMLRDSLLAPK